MEVKHTKVNHRVQMELIAFIFLALMNFQTNILKNILSNLKLRLS